MKKFSAQQIVQKLRQADVELGKGLNVKEVCRKIEIIGFASSFGTHASRPCR